MLHLFSGGVAHGIQLLHDGAQLVEAGTEVFDEEVVLRHFDSVVVDELLHAGTHERIAVLHMVFDEREWGAEDEAVHPQAQACQLHGKWVQVHAKDAALEEGAFQNLRVLGLVVQV